MASVTKTTGTKGSDVYSATGDPRVDLSVATVRGTDAATLTRHVLAAASKDLPDAVVLAFHARNVRGGKGERDVFRTLLLALRGAYPGLMDSLLDLVPHYGSWNDLLRLADDSAPLVGPVSALYGKQLQEDEGSCAAGAGGVAKSISLAAKWAPREKQGPRGAGSKGVTAAVLARQLFPALKPFSAQMKAYRQLVSGLNRRLDTLETHMAGGSWADIKPAGVPGRAGKLYSRALLNLVGTTKAGQRLAPDDKERLRHPDDPDRMTCRDAFLAHFAAAKEGTATVHGSKTLFPHEVVKKAVNMLDPRYEDGSAAAPVKEGGDAERDQLSAVWRDMVKDARTPASPGGRSGLEDCIFMCDFSGSMRSSDTNRDTPYWVSMALGILGAAAGSEAWRGRFMTFDSEPRWHTLPESGELFDCLRRVAFSNMGCGLSTDFQRAMDLVLTHVKANRLRQDQLPKNLVVLTDMNFDAACASAGTNAYTGYGGYRHHVKTAPWQTHFEAIQETFRRAGEDMWGVPFVPPRIVVWNLAANPTDFHATAETPGVMMLSGWSATLFNILKKEGPRQATPLELLRLELDAPQYDRLRKRVADWMLRNVFVN